MSRENGISRRALLGGAAAGAAAVASGAAGAAAAYRYRAEIGALKLATLARPLEVPEESHTFRRDALAIERRREQQTVESVAALKKKYEEPVTGRVRVWDLVERLAACVDPTDMRLFCASQLVHVQQIWAAMEENGVEDRDLLLLAVLHDLGKVVLTDEAPENVYCGVGRLSEGTDGAGLDRVVYQFGHGELLYSRLRDHVPAHVAFVIRYHNVSPDDSLRFMTEEERDWTARYLRPFQRYDGGFATPYFLPKVDMRKVRELVEERFPQPILV